MSKNDADLEYNFDWKVLSNTPKKIEKPKYIKFKYQDKDTKSQEIGDILSYLEKKEIQTFFYSIFSKFMNEYFFPKKFWTELSTKEQTNFIEICLEKLEMNSKEQRRESLICLNIISFGLFLSHDDPQVENSESKINHPVNLESIEWNNRLIRECDGLQILLNTFILISSQFSSTEKNLDKFLVSSPIDLRLVLNLILVLIEIYSNDKEFEDELIFFKFEGDGIIQRLFRLISDSNDKPERCYPIKKIILFLWKMLLIHNKTLCSRNTELNPSLEPKATQQEFDKYHQYIQDKFSTFLPRSKNGIPTSFIDGEEVFKKAIEIRNQKPKYEDLKMNKFAKLIKHEFKNFRRYLILLLKILLASMPFQGYEVQFKIDSEVHSNSEELDQIVREVDYKRNKEIIMKATSAILLLLLKLSKKFDLLQFEYFNEVFVDSNCVLMILKLLNIELQTFLESETISPNDELINIEETILKKEMEIENENENENEKEKENDLIKNKHLNFRNTFATINLIRILQKMIKKKEFRIKNIFVKKKGHIILRKTLNIRIKVLRFYALKAIKNSIRYLTQKWKSSNINIISDIYTNLRNELAENWIEVQDQESISSETLRLEEERLRNQISEFIEKFETKDSEMEKIARLEFQFTNEPQNIEEELDSVEVPNDFEDNFSEWLQDEVYPHSFFFQNSILL
ncbi:protein required for hyphal anastomosis ham-2 [Anaeramoeba ignava]|uniref:Protein required for hyphal anastomosis ham-2 n=1 Tax=Anaeramoeba ignava TaxID=1746090 RepID=A0A9Q0L764_ANAIG|nr:protein required for hyphal anastomosis ham-2 [Anaeramoeba ignava]